MCVINFVSVKNRNVCSSDGFTSFRCMPIIDLPGEVECGKEPQRSEHQIDHQQQTGRSCTHTHTHAELVIMLQCQSDTQGEASWKFLFSTQKFFFLSVCAAGLT